MASNIPIPKPLIMNGNLSQNWKIFKRDWNNFETASKLKSEDMEIRVATLLTCIGSDAMNLFDGFNLSDDDANDIAKIKDAFEKHCIGETNETYERFIFNSRQQLQTESVDVYIAELRKLAKTCNFGTLEESLIRDKLVIGTICDTTRRRLLQEPELTLTKAITIARSLEISKTQMSEIQNTDLSVNKLFKSRSTDHKQNMTSSLKPCHFCCKPHVFKKELCPAYGKICSRCKGKNHFASSKYCKGNIKCVFSDTNAESEEQDNAAWLSVVDSGKLKSKATLMVNDLEVEFHLDTGADVNTLCQKYVHRNQLKPTTTKLVMWNGTKMNPLGEVELNVLNKKTNLFHNIKFIVVNNDLSCLLGLKTLKELNFITVNEKLISKIDTSENLGDLGEAHLSVDSSKKPRQLPCRRVPFALQSRVKDELDRMVERGIIQPVTEPTEWVSQMAVAEKTNGQLRICIDPAYLNEALQREHYRLPTLDDVLEQLKDARLFTKLDIKEAYWHVKLDEESSYLTTMITPVGRFRWLRLPFGLKVSSEIFQRKLCEAITGLQNTINVADDIILAGCGRNDEEAKANLTTRTNELKARCTEQKIILNDKKTVSEQKEIIFMGHRITAEGISPDPAKIEAIHNLPTPTDVSAVRRLCGTIQYLARFIPNLSQHLEPLRALTKKNAEWIWTTECQTAFEKVKTMVEENCKLAYFDNDKEVELQVDSSKDGVGVCLMQDGYPIEFASKSLSATQRKWAQIEKELLAVIIGLERFDHYTYGRKVTVTNDHKPLANILKKPLSEAPRRLQNLLMRLHRYDVEFQYMEGPKLLIADTLSRAVGTKSSHDIPDIRICTISESSISDPMMENIRNATLADEILQELIGYTTDGWPEKSNWPKQLTPYREIKDSLSVDNGILFKGEQVIIPNTLRLLVKEKLHAAHLGYDSMVRRSRSTVYWPGIQQEIKQMAEKCETCQQHSPKNQKETLKHIEDGSHPWEKIGADLCEIGGHQYLIVVDYFSHYIEIEHLSTTTSTQIIRKLKPMFARWGRPIHLITDCGSQFLSNEFQQFLKKWQIKHSTSSPYHHQGNGKAESAVKIMKNLFKKTTENGEDPFMGLLELRNTPRQDSKSPIEIMLGRKPRTFLPHKIETEIIDPKRAKRKETIKRSHDKHAQDLDNLAVNSPTYFQNSKNEWGRGKVLSRNGRKYKILSEDGAIYHRNRVHLRPKYTPFVDNFSAAETSTENHETTTSPDEENNMQRPKRVKKPPFWHRDYEQY